jgi:hypothetical protein
MLPIQQASKHNRLDRKLSLGANSRGQWDSLCKVRKFLQSRSFDREGIHLLLGC